MRNRPTVTAIVDGWRFERVSSEYVDVTPPGQSSPVDVVNVFDYATGTSDVPWTVAATRAAGRRWLSAHADDVDAFVEWGSYASR